MADTAIELHLTGRLRPGAFPELIEYLRQAVPTYERPGGIRVRLYRSVEEPDVFREVIAYATRDAYLADQERAESDPEMSELLTQWHALLVEPVRVEAFELVDSNVGETFR